MVSLSPGWEKIFCYYVTTDLSTPALASLRSRWQDTMSFRPVDQKAALLSFRAKVRSTVVEKSFCAVRISRLRLCEPSLEMTRFMFTMFFMFSVFFNVLLCFYVLVFYYVLIYYINISVCRISEAKLPAKRCWQVFFIAVCINISNSCSLRKTCYAILFFAQPLCPRLFLRKYVYAAVPALKNR